MESSMSDSPEETKTNPLIGAIAYSVLFIPIFLLIAGAIMSSIGMGKHGLEGWIARILLIACVFSAIYMAKRIAYRDPDSKTSKVLGYFTSSLFGLIGILWVVTLFTGNDSATDQVIASKNQSVTGSVAAKKVEASESVELKRKKIKLALTCSGVQTAIVDKLVKIPAYGINDRKNYEMLIDVLTLKSKKWESWAKNFDERLFEEAVNKGVLLDSIKNTMKDLNNVTHLNMDAWMNSNMQLIDFCGGNNTLMGNG